MTISEFHESRLINKIFTNNSSPESAFKDDYIHSATLLSLFSGVETDCFFGMPSLRFYKVNEHTMM